MTRRSTFAAVIVMMLTVAAGARGQTPDQGRFDEQSVKALFLYNFALFVEWPDAGAGRPFVIGVVGDNGIVKALERIGREKNVRGRTIEVRSLAPGEDPSSCQLLFVTEEGDRQTPGVLRGSRGPVLTVGEAPLFLRDGGMIRLLMDGDRVRFQINNTAAQNAGLHVSSRLLSLAVR